MKKIKLGINNDEVQKRFDICCEEITATINKYLPEIVESWNKKDPNSFFERVCMTMYLEMIHSGFFDQEINK